MTADRPHTHQDHHTHAEHAHPREGGPKVIAAAASSHAEHAGHGGHDHGAMVADFRRRFWVTLILTPPVLLLSPMIQHWFGIAEAMASRATATSSSRSRPSPMFMAAGRS